MIMGQHSLEIFANKAVSNLLVISSIYTIHFFVLFCFILNLENIPDVFVLQYSAGLTA